MSALDTSLFLSKQIPDLYREFKVRRFRAPSIAWINLRHWRQLGEANTSEALADLERRLLETFGASAQGPHDPDEIFRPGTHSLYADRYGGPLGAVHGGSGRSGSLGDLNAKGIGATPLCSTSADWYHSHGCVWLEEAIREAVFSELAWLEFPQGANPVVAIIDTGEAIYWPDGTTGDRRSIIVRAASTRLAHLERSIFFGSSGRPGSDQVIDASRVAQAVRHLEGEAEGANLNAHSLTERVDEMFERIATQIGFGHFHRVTHGDYYSSNLAYTGALLDFGSFRSLPDWCRSFCVSDAPGFGEEMNNLVPSIRSIAFYITKYANSSAAVGVKTVTDKFNQYVSDAFRNELAKIVAPCASDRIADDVVNVLIEEFQRQQGVGRNYLNGDTDRSGGGWLYHGLTGGPEGRRDPTAYEAGQALRLLVRSTEKTPEAEALAARLVRWATPRPLMGRERLQALIYRMVRKLNLAPHQGLGSEERATIAAFVDVQLSRSRRAFPTRSLTEVVEGHASNLTTRLFVCRDIDGVGHLRLEGLPVEGEVEIFGETIPVAGLSSDVQLAAQGFSSWTLRKDAFDPNRGLMIAGKVIPTPGLSAYPDLFSGSADGL